MTKDNAKHLAWMTAFAVLFAATEAVAGCPYANGPKGTDGADSAYVQSQYGKHIGRRTRVKATPRESTERSAVSSDYGQHIGTTRSRTRLRSR